MGARTLVLFGICAIVFAIGKPVEAEMTSSSLVVGTAKCLDCSRKNNIKPEHAFQGQNVAIKCKTGSGEYETKAVGQIDGKGAFSIPLAAELLRDDGELKQECQAELQSAASTPCDVKPSKLVVHKSDDSKHTFATATGALPFASATCASDFLWKWKRDLFHKFHKHFFPAPAYKSPQPQYKPPTPAYGQPAPEYKPTPVYGQPAPVYGKPAPGYGQPAPVYGKPTPEYGQPAPEYKPAPVYTPTPVYGKPAPYYKKPFPFFHPHPWKKFFKKTHPFWPPAANKQEGNKN